MPISLIGCMYKVISKILTNCLVVVLGGLVNEIQSAFVADKQILDGISVKDDKVKQPAAKIGCNTLKTPFSYLESKVGGCMPRIRSWNETIKRMACRLSKWKLKTLLIGGRLTLLKFVLVAMPLYHMSLFKVPKKVLHRMESMRSHFFNVAELSSKKLVWVK
nr:RNA-directed DNA polymerase, eukaryota, reverse transcriptase zinc-binding domain protein [Tanacetum cinerariifolium]